MSGMEGIVGGTKRKREYQSLEELLATPWCYYCDRSFSDDKVLHEHQKAKHFQCIVGNCHRRLNTAGGLRVHMQQVHKEELHEVDNAIEGRRDPNQEIFGTVGIPEAVAEQRVATLTQQYQALQREHRRKTGNPLPGEVKDNANAPATVSKTQQLTEGLSDIKARIAAAKAKKAAEKAALAAGGTLPTAATPTPPTTSVPMNGSATPEIKRENSQPAPTPAGFHGALAQTYPGSPMGWPGSATFAPQAPGYVNSASPPPWPPHLPVHPHAPPPQFQGGYVPPPVHNGINNGFVQSSSYGGAPRQQHALPILPPTPANLPQRPGLAPPRPGSNGLPPHPGHSNGHTLPTPTAAAIRQAEAQAHPPNHAGDAMSAKLTEDFLAELSAANSSTEPGAIQNSMAQPQAATPAGPPSVALSPGATALAQNTPAAQPQPSTPHPAAKVKQSKKNSNEVAKMMISDILSTWEENRAQASQYQRMVELADS